MRPCAPSHLDASPRRHCSRSRPTSPTPSPWAAQWACGSSQKESTNIPNYISTRSQSGRIGCASTNNAQPCVLHILPPSPKKKEDSASMSPDVPSSKKKKLQLTRSCPPHPCCTRRPDSRPSRRARSARGWLSTPGSGTQRERTTRRDLSSGGEALTEPTGQRQTAGLHRKPPFSLPRVRRKSVVHYTDRRKGDETVHRGE